jgi:chromosome segregation ATPase
MAASMEETSRAMRSIEAEVHQLGKTVAEVQTSLRSAHARIQKIEAKLDGNGGDDGIKTELRVTQRDLKAAREDISTLEKWRQDVAKQSLAKAENKIEKTGDRHWSIYLAIIIAAISLLMSTVNCGPQVKAKYQEAKEAGNGGH